MPRSQTIKVLNVVPLSDADRARLDGISPRLKIEHRPGNEPAILAEIEDETAEVFIGDFPPGHAPSLRWIQLSSVGLDDLVLDSWAEGVIVTNAAGAYSVDMAEYVIGAFFRASQRMEARRAFQLRREWPIGDAFQQLLGQQLRGRTLVVVGYGSIGREVGRLAQSLGMRVLAVKARPDQRTYNGFCVPGTGDPLGTIPEQLLGVANLASAASEADYFVLTLPLTEATRGLVNADVIAQLPRHSWFVNVGRGAVADEKALAAALRERRLAGAVLDVFSEEPLPPSNSFWILPNVIITPHVSAASFEWLVDLFAENLRRFAEDEPLLNVVDAQRGY